MGYSIFQIKQAAMDTPAPDVTPPHETVAQLKQALSQAQAELKTLRQAQAQERVQREKVEYDLQASRQLLQLVMDTLPEAIFWKDLNLAYLGCNQNFAEDAGRASPQEMIGKTDYDMPWKTEEAEFYRECDRRVIESNQAEFGIIEPQLNGEGEETWLETNKAPLHDSAGNVIGVLGTYQDITQRKRAEVALQVLNQALELKNTELEEALARLNHSQIQLIQREKMSALGNLMAGIAHEINNPTNFLLGNLKPAREHLADLLGLLDVYQAEYPNPGDVVEDEIEAIDLPYIRKDFPKLLDSMGEGVKRIREISNSLRIFARSDAEEQVPFDLHEGLDGTLLILKPRLKADEQRPAIDVIKHYGAIPAVSCFPGQLNQVFMNILANAIDALEEGNQGKSFAEIKAQPNRITVTTERSPCQKWTVVRIQDNGMGMTAANRAKIFDRAFTTKAVGKGTGLGLAIAHQIIVDNHGGTIEVHSTPGQGTEFILQIP
ncbi:MAG: ATP-binding protein [Cyanobacteria bacterium]|nr:ATP-binding protein [Cyanobacteriota bacterium]